MCPHHFLVFDVHQCKGVIIIPPLQPVNHMRSQQLVTIQSIYNAENQALTYIFFFLVYEAGLLSTSQ